MKSKVIKYNGAYQFQVDDKIIDAIAFKSFRPTEKNVGDFYKAGVRIFHVYCSGLQSGIKAPYSLYGETWFGDHIYDFTNLDRQIDFFKKNAPEGYVFINIHMDVRQWWLDQNPGNVNSFTHLSQIACNEKWKKDTADYLKALIKHTEEKYNDFVIGYFLLGGYTTEWFSEFDWEESHPLKLQDYRKYMNNPDIDIPSKDILERPNEEIILKDNLDVILPYRKYHQNLIANTVLYFAHAAQEVLNHNKIVGLFFGYILELLWARMWNAGHIEFDMINQSKDIDLLATPSSYQFREFSGPGAYMLLCDSLYLNEKACFVSFDHTTYLVPSLPNDPKRLCNDPETSIALKLLAQMRSGNKKDLLQDRHQTIEAMRREYMQRMTKRVGYWWFDMFEGWFYDEKLMDEVKLEIDISHDIMKVERKSISEVAVFVSGQSLYYMNKMSNINTETICNQREGLNKMGAPYDIYSLTDISRVDLSQYKLVIFIECLLLTDEQREIIESLKNKNISMLFIGPVDYVHNGIASTSKLLNMPLKEVEGLEKTINGDLYSFGYNESKKDSYYVNSEDVTVLGTYAESKLSAFAYKKVNNSLIFYSGLGNLCYNALQEVLKLAGVHIYNYDGNAVFICEGLTGLYSPVLDKTTLYLKEDGTYQDVFTGDKFVSNNKQITFNTEERCARMLRKID